MTLVNPFRLSQFYRMLVGLCCCGRVDAP